MPKVSFDLPTGSSPAHRQTISDAVHTAMADTLGTASDAKFHVFHEYDASRLIHGGDPDGSPLFVTFFLAPRPTAVIEKLFAHAVAELETRAQIDRSALTLLISSAPTEHWWWQNAPAAASTP